MHRATGAGRPVAIAGASAGTGEIQWTTDVMTWRHFSARRMWKVSGDPQSQTGRAPLAADVNDQGGQHGGTRLDLSHVDVLVWSVRGCRITGAVLHRGDPTQAHEEAKV